MGGGENERMEKGGSEGNERKSKRLKIRIYEKKKGMNAIWREEDERNKKKKNGKRKNRKEL